jgi:hypothetical protein
MLVTSSCGIGGVMLSDVAFALVHISVLNPPAVMVVGDATSVAAGAASGVGDGVGVGVGTGVGVGVGIGVGVGSGAPEEAPAHPAIKMPNKNRAAAEMTRQVNLRT